MSENQAPEDPGMAGDHGRYTHFAVIDAEYYETGPEQGRPPDGRIEAGTKVRLLGQQKGGYEEVEAETGVKGYVDGGRLKSLA